LAYAQHHDLDALSLLLRQECGTFWERIVLPLAYQNIFALLSPHHAPLNGQYILIRRDVYLNSGGFGAVRGRIMEDVALGRLLTAKGYKIALVNGHQIASVRMYRSLRDLLAGMTKTAFTAARDQGLPGFVLGLFTFFGTLSLIILILGMLSANLIVVLAGLLLIAITAFWLRPWVRRFGVQPVYALLNSIGVILLLWIGFVSTIQAITGRGVRWKGRNIIEQRES
jgi:hypothetical protein